MGCNSLLRISTLSQEVHYSKCTQYAILCCVLVGIYCCLFNNKWIISGGGDGLVIVWDATTGLHRLTLSGHAEEIVSK